MTASPTLNIALAQINPTVGDIDGNAAKILEYYNKAKGEGAQLVVCPELSLIGYPPEDLVQMPSFCQRVMAKIVEIAPQVQGAGLIFGTPWQDEEAVYNAAVMMDEGKVIHVQPKTMLPNYGIFDEKRLFAAGEGPNVVEWRGMKLGLLICEDIWYPGLAVDCKQQGADILVVINASPFEAGKLAQRYEVTAQAVAQAGVPLIYVNAVGGQDDIVFDGGSFVMAENGDIVAQAPEFEEVLFNVNNSTSMPPLDLQEAVWRAMMLALRDYVKKNGFPGVALGLSGGIDSALSATAAVDALGRERVKAVLLPSPYTSKDSVEDALELAKRLGIETMQVPITPGMDVMEKSLNPVLQKDGWMRDVTLGGNVQARLRGITLMAISNRFGWMLLSTGNKSEIAVGYSTLYGDSCGGYNVLKDIYKMQVYELAEWRNSQGAVIPQRSIERPPSAELAPGQKDEDQLPPYETLDQILLMHIEGQMGAEEIIAQGFDAEVVRKVVRMVKMSEYKRRQSCPGVKLSPMMFGRDRRFPLTNKA